MQELKDKILSEGIAIGTEIIKVDMFLNHQIDIEFMEKIGAEFKHRFGDIKVDKILTIEASGIAIASIASKYFGYPRIVFAKKAAPSTMVDGFYEAEVKSFTKGTVSKAKVAKQFLSQGEKVLILDDFMASGQAAIALADIVEQAGAEVVGIGAVIEKYYQNGSNILREKGYKVESLAVVDKIEDGVITFR